MRSNVRDHFLFSDFDKIVTDIPELGDYKLPSHEASDELFALSELSSAMRTESSLALHYLMLSNEVLKSATPSSPQPKWFSTHLDFDDILDAISQEDPTKHPGYPACMFGFNKGDVIDNYLFLLVDAICYRLLALEFIGPHCTTPEEFYQSFCSDYSSISIKHEPVKVGKIGRIICSTSLVSSIVEELLYHHFNVSFKECVYETYSAIGVGFTTLDSELLHASSCLPVFNSDVPKFDSTMTDFEALLNVDASIDSYRNVPPRIIKMMKSMERAYMNKIFILSNGSLYCQTMPGLQGTGRKQTANFNTMCRARRAYAVDLWLRMQGERIETSVICAGDDSGERPHFRKEEAYSTLGFPLRDAHTSEEQDFCSHIWPVGCKPVGTRLYKSLFKLLLSEPIALDPFAAFCREFSTHGDFPAVLNIISVHRPEVKVLISFLQFMSQNISNKLNIPHYDECRRKKRQGVASSNRGLRVRGKGDYNIEDPQANYDELDSRLKKIENKSTLLKKGVGTAGSALGRLAGGWLGQGDLGSRLGSKAADALSGWLGIGDYELKTNSLIKGDVPMDVPKFSSSKRGVRFTDKEYIGDIFSASTLSGGSSVFSLGNYTINPGDPTTFPWLSTIARQFDQYEPHGIVFEFVSTSSDYNGASQSLGTVVMATDYDPSDPSYPDKRTMEQADYSCSGKTSNNLYHGIECDPKERGDRVLYVRGNSVPNGESKKFYDLGNLQVATQGVSATGINLGELWVSYDITFFKKQATDVFPTAYLSSGPFTAADPFGITSLTAFNKQIEIVAAYAGLTATYSSLSPKSFYCWIWDGKTTTSMTWTGAATCTVSGALNVRTNNSMEFATSYLHSYLFVIFQTDDLGSSVSITMPAISNVTNGILAHTTLTKMNSRTFD